MSVRMAASLRTRSHIVPTRVPIRTWLQRLRIVPTPATRWFPFRVLRHNAGFPVLLWVSELLPFERSARSMCLLSCTSAIKGGKESMQYLCAHVHMSWIVWDNISNLWKSEADISTRLTCRQRHIGEGHPSFFPKHAVSRIRKKNYIYTKKATHPLHDVYSMLASAFPKPD
jgi:hypothetical protein